MGSEGGCGQGLHCTGWVADTAMRLVGVITVVGMVVSLVSWVAAVRLH